MRGKHFTVYIAPWCCRITPAYAGKTEPYLSIVPRLKDHPRVCGENASLGSDYLFILGSPPRMRGKLTITAPDELGNGITPAYAGKTMLRQPECACRTDHPRVCGENFDEILSLEGGAGSPPRMRGKPAERAAKTNTGRDHPRVCGENCKGHCLQTVMMGSPPRMRGKLFFTFEIIQIPGITPAYAGKTRKLRICNAFNRDHPRVCGENHLILVNSPSNSGITPAYAGKT